LPKHVTDIGHIILQVGNMDRAIRLYCGTLGFDLKDRSAEWTVISTKLGELTLCKTRMVTPLVLRDADETPVILHVDDFKAAAAQLEKEGYSVHRVGRNSGTLTDPWGNKIGLHDHKKSVGHQQSEPLSKN